jgi:ELWxxDGT repeat protein
LTALGPKLYFVADDSTGTELWVSDGTSPGTMRLSDNLIAPIGDLTAAGKTLFFSGADLVHGTELWKF